MTPPRLSLEHALIFGLERPHLFNKLLGGGETAKEVGSQGRPSFCFFMYMGGGGRLSTSPGFCLHRTIFIIKKIWDSPPPLDLPYKTVVINLAIGYFLIGAWLIDVKEDESATCMYECAAEGY